jgi:hypothetical protein
MTEADWLLNAKVDGEVFAGLGKVFAGLEGKVGGRKLRLFAAACGRHVWQRLEKPGLRDAIELAERYADGSGSLRTLSSCRNKLRATYGDSATGGWAYSLALYAIEKNALPAARYTAVGVVSLAMYALSTPVGDQNRCRHPEVRAEIDCTLALLRDVVGDPLRPAPAVDAAWLTWRDGTVSRLAAAAYNERQLPEGKLDLHRLALLADALEDAGCGEAELLAHLRSQGPHVRGCWALDLILGKE